MKICFFTTDKSIKDLSKRMEGVEISIFNSKSNVINYIENNPNDRILLFMDLDEGDEAHDINREYIDHNKAIRILITEKVPLKKLKKHQLSKESAFGYIKKPLTPELVSGILNDFELSDYVIQNDLTHEGDKLEKEQVDLTFIGIKKPNLDDVELEEEEEQEQQDITQGHIEEFRVAPPVEDEMEGFEIDIDLDNDGFGIDESDDSDSSVENLLNANEQMSSEEEHLLTEHGVISEDASNAFNSLANENIQEKFDKVFGVEKKNDHGPTNEDMPIDQQDMISNEDLSDISINLDDMDSGDTTEQIKAKEIKDANSSFIVSLDEINLGDDSTATNKSMNAVIIEEAIINDPDLDGQPASAIIDATKAEDSANLMSIIDDVSSNSEATGFAELSLSSIEISGEDEFIIDNARAGDSSKVVKEEVIEPEAVIEDTSGLKKGHIEDGYMYMGGDPSDAKNWQEVK